MIYQNYIWDFDGTLFDSYPHIAECCWRMLSETGRTAGFDKEQIQRLLQLSFADMRRATGMPDDEYRRFVVQSHLVGEDEIEPKAVPFSDCEAVLAAIVEGGGHNYLYTHRDKSALWYLCTYGLEGYFAGWITSEDGFPSKPAPDAVLALIERYALDPAACVMVGDREIDGMSGKNAGIAGALVNYPPALPDGTSPAAVTQMDHTAQSLTEFAREMGIF